MWISPPYFSHLRPVRVRDRVVVEALEVGPKRRERGGGQGDRRLRGSVAKELQTSDQQRRTDPRDRARV